MRRTRKKSVTSSERLCISRKKYHLKEIEKICIINNITNQLRLIDLLVL